MDGVAVKRHQASRSRPSVAEFLERRSWQSDSDDKLPAKVRRNSHKPFSSNNSDSSNRGSRKPAVKQARRASCCSPKLAGYRRDDSEPDGRLSAVIAAFKENYHTPEPKYTPEANTPDPHQHHNNHHPEPHHTHKIKKRASRGLLPSKPSYKPGEIDSAHKGSRTILKKRDPADFEKKGEKNDRLIDEDDHTEKLHLPSFHSFMDNVFTKPPSGLFLSNTLDLDCPAGDSPGCWETFASCIQIEDFAAVHLNVNENNIPIMVSGNGTFLDLVEKNPWELANKEFSSILMPGDSFTSQLYCLIADHMKTKTLLIVSETLPPSVKLLRVHILSGTRPVPRCCFGTIATSDIADLMLVLVPIPGCCKLSEQDINHSRSVKQLLQQLNRYLRLQEGC